MEGICPLVCVAVCVKCGMVIMQMWELQAKLSSVLAVSGMLIDDVIGDPTDCLCV